VPAAQRGRLPRAGRLRTRVRLCKGAYSEPESVAFTSRREIDSSYARCLRALMNGSGYPMLATHDPRLIEITRRWPC
jgi:Proline dehydrogenase